eukprot:1851916-Rhodomonas_salina.2
MLAPRFVPDIAGIHLDHVVSALSDDQARRCCLSDPCRCPHMLARPTPTSFSQCLKSHASSPNASSLKPKVSIHTALGPRSSSLTADHCPLTADR